MPALPKQQVRIAGLDGLRGVAATLVFIEHFLFKGLGDFGVYLFFVLSGFLIVGILHKQRLKIELNGQHGISKEFFSFWSRRIRRIFPIYYLALLFVLIVQIGILHQRGLYENGLNFYFLMLGNFYVQHFAHHWSWFSHLWSISPEQQFYMLASPLLLFISSRFHGKLLAAWFLFSACAFCADLFYSDGVNVPYLTSRSLFLFMTAGGFLAISVGTAKKRKALNAWVAVLGIVCTLAIGIMWNTSDKWNPCYIGCFWLCSLTAGVGSIRYLYCFQTSWAARCLDCPPLRYLGTISYGFYVYHYFIPIVMTYIPGNRALQRTGHLLYPIMEYAMTVAIASVSWEFFEKKILRRV